MVYETSSCSETERLASGRAYLAEVYGKTRWQRCWVHKTTVNILNKLPKAVQSKAKEALHEICPFMALSLPVVIVC